MEEVEFCRNLRGVNDGKDFPKEFLSHIYHSICSGEALLYDSCSPSSSLAQLGILILYCTLRLQLSWCVRSQHELASQVTDAPQFCASLSGFAPAMCASPHPRICCSTYPCIDIHTAQRSLPRPPRFPTCSAHHAAPLAINDSVGDLNLAGPSAGASWALMADRSKLQRGTALLLPPEGMSCNYHISDHGLWSWWW